MKTTPLVIDFWIVRKAKDARAPAWLVSRPSEFHPSACLFCGEDYEGAALIVFRERLNVWPDPFIDTARICAGCARHSDERLAEMTQEIMFPDRVAELLYGVPANMVELIKTCDELAAMGILETIDVHPVTGMKQRRIRAKGQDQLDLDLAAEAQRRSRH